MSPEEASRYNHFQTVRFGIGRGSLRHAVTGRHRSQEEINRYIQYKKNKRAQAFRKWQDTTNKKYVRWKNKKDRKKLNKKVLSYKHSSVCRYIKNNNACTKDPLCHWSYNKNTCIDKVSPPKYVDSPTYKAPKFLKCKDRFQKTCTDPCKWQYYQQKCVNKKDIENVKSNYRTTKNWEQGISWNKEKQNSGLSGIELKSLPRIKPRKITSMQDLSYSQPQNQVLFELKHSPEEKHSSKTRSFDYARRIGGAFAFTGSSSHKSSKKSQPQPYSKKYSDSSFDFDPDPRKVPLHFLTHKFTGSSKVIPPARGFGVRGAQPYTKRQSREIARRHAHIISRANKKRMESRREQKIRARNEARRRRLANDGIYSSRPSTWPTPPKRKL
jgi:hypothetical protein